MNNIILIGFMGSGKTTFGRWLTRSKKMNFVDTDDYIEAKEGRKIKDIFAVDGEEYFRDLETETIKQLILASYCDTVFSVGGGLPVRPQNGAMLKELGTVVYLKAKTETLVKRLSGDKNRPLLQGGDVRTKIENLMEKRASIYENTADIIINTDELMYEQIYERIKEYENTRN